MPQTTTQDKPARLWRLLVTMQNPIMKWLLRSPLHSVVSGTYMLLTITGRRTGTVYTTPVQYAQQGDVLYAITSAGYTWWKNLRGGAEVKVLLRGKSLSGQAEASTAPQMVGALLRRVYPALGSEKRAAFVAGKVAVTVTLQGEKAML